MTRKIGKRSGIKLNDRERHKHHHRMNGYDEQLQLGLTDMICDCGARRKDLFPAEVWHCEYCGRQYQAPE